MEFIIITNRWIKNMLYAWFIIITNRKRVGYIDIDNSEFRSIDKSNKWYKYEPNS